MQLRVLLALVAALGATYALAQQPRPAPVRAQPLDRVVAIVNDEAITLYELDDAKRIVLESLKKQNVAQPSSDVLDRQVLERLITERSIIQYAKDNGIKVDDTQVERTIQRIAEDNKMTVDDVRKSLARDNIPYSRYREDIRNEITVQRVREREVDSHITVSDSEIDIYLAALKAQGGREQGGASKATGSPAATASTLGSAASTID